MFDFLKSVPSMDADDVMNARDGKEALVLLDVRTPEEYRKGYIENSIHIPLDQIGEKVAIAIPEKNQKVVVYCLSGSRSISAVHEMMKMGYTHVFTLSSGLLGWRAKRYPLTTVQK